jgi:hypothetical protein
LTSLQKLSLGGESSNHDKLMNAKREAMEGIAAAKRDLLRHSLDMMVKQGQITQNGKGFSL